MRTIRLKNFFLLLLVVCFSTAASAQLQDGKVETATQYITKDNIQKSMACPYGADWEKANCPDGWYPGCCEPENKAIMGIAVENAENNGGAFISEVKANGGAANSDLFAKDVITKIDKASISNADELIKALAKYNPNDKVKVTFLRDDKQKTTKVVLGKRPVPAVDNKNAYENISTQEDVKVVRLKQGDLEKLLNGEEITMPIAEKNMAATEQISIQLDSNVGVDCPEFNVVITKLNQKDIEILSETDTEIDIDRMTELEVINLNLYPNPNEGLFDLNFRLVEDQPVLVRIISLNGKEVYREDISNFEGTYANKINITENSAGVYVLQVVQGERMMSRKIIIE